MDFRGASGMIRRGYRTFTIMAAAALLVMLILVLSTMFIGAVTRADTGRAVKSVSVMFLDELVGRRKEVVESRLKEQIGVINVAIKLMTENDLGDKSRLEAYQYRMRQLFKLDKFAFVDEKGIIYTSAGYQRNIGDYSFDYETITSPEISVLNLDSRNKKVVIAVPINIRFLETVFRVCFMEIDMREMLSGVSMGNDETDSTYTNMYTRSGISLSDMVLDGQTGENNLLKVLDSAEFKDGYSYEKLSHDFKNGVKGVTAFTYKGEDEALSYEPVAGTDWMMTFLVRKNVIAGLVYSVSETIIARAVIQSFLIVFILLGMCTFIILQIRKNGRLELEKEKAEVESRIKHQELEERILLQKKLLEEEKFRSQQDQMITAMASDYRAVYYVNLDNDDGVCFRADPEDKVQTPEGVHFSYTERFLWYAENVVDPEYRQGFISFINPANIRNGLSSEKILAYRYLARRTGTEYYEMIRVAGVRSADDVRDNSLHAIGLGLTVIDSEMRRSMEQSRALHDALSAAESANKAKTAFLSSMSHEIRTPMNAIIGLDNIALSHPDINHEVRTYLEKIGTSAHHLLNIINDILDMSRIESGRMIIKNENFSFSRTLEQINTIISGQCNDKGISYDCRVIGQIDDYYIGDDMKLRQIMINILGNSVKFTPKGGSVNFSIEEIARFDGKSTIRFVISDNGIGMSEEFLPHLFDTFSQENSSTTSRYGSTGLGMSITKCIVDLMNGQIDVKSRKGEGTIFTVTLTMSQSTASTDNEETVEFNPDDISVLIVDDDPVAVEHAKLILTQMGMHCDAASCGTECVEKVMFSHARRHDYNLILMDWKMPDFDGIEATRRVREIVGGDTSVIILTAYNWDDIACEAKQAGVDSFVSKPLLAGDIHHEFREILKKKRNPAIRKKADLEGRHILLAEDVAVNAEIMCMLLGTRKMKTDHAVNGKIAVEMFSASEEGYYDAVLMDMRMPEMDGLEATRQIRAMNRSDAKVIPIVALTANAFDEDVQRSMQAGLNAHLSKPVDPGTLFETLEELISDDP